MMKEEWRPVVGSGGRYEVSNLGNVRSFAQSRTPKLMSLHLSDRGYPSVALRLTLGGAPVTTKVHQLVLAAFVGPKPPGREVRHLDGVRTNNHLANLAYGTHAQNAQDAVTHGTNRESRKTRCPIGHPYDDANTYHRGPGWRACRACRTARKRAWRAKRKAMAA